jgi:hypothetical protein
LFGWLWSSVVFNLTWNEGSVVAPASRSAIHDLPPNLGMILFDSYPRPKPIGLLLQMWSFPTLYSTASLLDSDAGDSLIWS